MIQTDITDPFGISNLGELRAWLAENKHLPDDTEIQVLGDSGGDEEPVITLAKREWRPNEQGCMVTYDKDNKRTQVDQTLIVIREWEPGDFDNEDEEESAGPPLQFPVRPPASEDLT